ncbi:MAG: hypothetical protein Q4D60_09655 [Eubacteriales bacterium]|nr:hypothetical protein [Eubacteriales bacterium]
MRHRCLKKTKKYGMVMVILLVISMLAATVKTGVMAAEGVGSGGRMSSPYDAEAEGSITVQLQDIKKNMENVQLALYKVGVIDTSQNNIRFAIVEELKNTNVDLNRLTSGDDVVKAGEMLESSIRSQQMKPLKTVVTNEAGQAVFPSLEQGMYLIRQETKGSYGTVQTILTAIPQIEDGEHWLYDVTAYPKGYGAEAGTIEVTKYLKYLKGTTLVEAKAKDETYYIGLFMDSDGTIPYRGKGENVKQVRIQNHSSGTVVFEDLPEAVYYIYETDAQGNAIPYRQEQEKDGGKWYAIAGENLLAENGAIAPEIRLDEDKKSGAAAISNVYYELPDGFYNLGEISITKSVTYNGEMITAKDTFYAGVFKRDASGEEVLMTVEQTESDGVRSERSVITLNQNGKVTVEVPLGGEDGTEAATYIVRETDENGRPVDKATFPYTVSGEGEVTVSPENPEGEVHLINALVDSDGYYEESSETTESSEEEKRNNNTGTTGGGGSNTRSGSTKTRDDNPIGLYAALLAGAILAGGVVMRRRQRK